MKKIFFILIIFQGILLSQFYQIGTFDPTAFDPNNPNAPYHDDFGIRTIIMADDINQNGKQEIIATDYSSGGNVHVMELNVQGYLEVIWSSPDHQDDNPNSTPRWVQTGDLDGDGNMEIIFPRGPRYDGEIQVWEYDGDGGFGTTPCLVLQSEDASMIFGTGVSYRMDRESGVVYDFDSDGKDELVTILSNSSVVILGVEGNIPGFATWAVEGGDPIVHPENRFSGGSHFHTFPCDFDGDGVKDIVNHYWNYYGFWSIEPLGPDQYRYPTPQFDNRNDHYYEYLNDAGYDAVAYMTIKTPDVDGDGNEEIVGITYSAGTHSYDVALVDLGIEDEGVYVWDNQPQQFGWIAEDLWTITGATEGSFWALEEYDFDQDGKDEIYIGGYSNMSVTSLRFTGNDILSADSYTAELLLTRPEQFSFVNVYDSLGISVDTIFQESPFATKVIAGMDMNNNGKKELAVSYQSIVDSVTYTYYEYNQSTLQYEVVSIIKVPSVNVESISLYEFDSGYVPPNQWSINLMAADPAGRAGQILKLGQHPEATDGIDATLGEEELPPVPPAGAFDARLTLPVAGTPASLKDYRNSENDEITWKVRFQPGESGYPVTLSWNSNSLPQGNFTLSDEYGGFIINVNMREESSCVIVNPSLNTLLIEYSQEVDANVSINNGWNLVSVPVMAQDMLVESLFPTATSDAFAFNSGYTAVDEFAVGEGYWLKFPTEEEVTITGMPYSEPVEVSAGWNLVGPFHYEVNPEMIASNPAGIIGGSFFGYEAGYFTATSLTPGKGYWIKMNSSGELIMPNPMAAKMSGKPEKINDAAHYTIDIIAQGDSGWTEELYIGIDPAATDGIDAHLNEFELPPSPPFGVMDARLVLPDNITPSFRDFRQGSDSFTGTKTYIVKWQLTTFDERMTLHFNIPEVPGTVFLTVQDPFGGLIINETFSEGTGELLITNTALAEVYLIVDYNGPIPVELSSFTANVVGETIQLAWETATETNNKGFEVERSEDKATFTKVGYIEGKGTTSENQSYSFTDHHAVSGTYYYRLRQVDFDGTSSYSEAVEVDFVPTEYSLGQNYPNPFNPGTKIKFAVPVESKVTVTLYNMLGQKVQEIVSQNYSAGLHEVDFNASELSSGMYIYSITAQGVDGSNFVDTKKMMLMK